MNSHPPAPALAPRRNWARRLVNLLVALVVIAVAAATFVFSYDGVHAIALLGGMSAQLARYYPGLFDAVLVIACVAALVLRDGRWWARAWAWVVLVAVLAAIGATDVLHAMNYALPHRTTEGIVAAAPVVAVLLAFSLLLTLLRQSRSQPAGEEPDDSAARRPSVPAPLALPALPAAVPAADAATVETPVLTTGPAIRQPAPPIALPAGTGATPHTPPDGLPAMTGPATAPNETLPPAAPPAASSRSPEGEPAPPTVSSPALGPAQAPPAAAEPAEPAPARPQGIRYAGSGVPGRSAVEPGTAEPGTAEPRTAEPGTAEPGTAEPAAEPSAAPGKSDRADDDYWDGEDAGPFAGLVYPAREVSTGPEDAAGEGGSAGGTDDGAGRAKGTDDADADGPAPRREAQEIDEDAPPFATAPFATVPRLNRVRSMPVPPEDDEAE
jgi:Protein of unknown function (DUF2637)